MWCRMLAGAVGLVACVASAAPVDLTFRAEAGAELRYRADGEMSVVQGAMGQNLEIGREAEHVARLRVLERGEDGAKMVLTYESLKANVKMPMGNAEVDTSTPEAEGESPLQAAARGLIGKEITFRLTDEGVEDLSVPFTPPMSQQGQFLFQPLVGEEDLKNALEALLLVTGEKTSVEPGETWEETEELQIEVGQLETVQTFTAQEPEEGVLPIEYSAEMTITQTPPGMTASIKEGENKGTIRWDVKRGLARSLEATSVMDLAIDYQGTPVVWTVKSSSKTELVEGAQGPATKPAAKSTGAAPGGASGS